MSLYKIPNQEAIDEDLKTVGHNLWTRSFATSGHALNLKRYAPVLSLSYFNPIPFIFENILNFGDRLDNAYFDSMYSIRLPLMKKLAKWCNGKGTKYTKEDLKKNNSLAVAGHAKDNALASNNVRKATRSIGSGVLTTATSYKYIPCGSNKFYVVFFTFDGDSIEDAKVLKGSGDNYSVTNITEWNKVSKDEYIKK